MTPTLIKNLIAMRDDINHYDPHSYYYCIDAFKIPENHSEWSECPKCGLKPKTWVFDNGEHTACGCWKSKYKHFDIQSPQTIAENVKNTGGFVGYDSDAHRKKWNEYCCTQPSQALTTEPGK